MISLVEQGKSVEDARAHAKQRYGLSDEAINARLHEAMDDAARTMSGAVLLGAYRP
jgi:hypothetical protein